jgi:(1->4)-alpha-D-glucan 1-alpha-D-glucosylmutase
MPSLRIPTATYRLQFNQRFGFEDARKLVPYLHRLGVTDLYASPILKARRGSSHGYDVADPSQLNPELGTEAEFVALVRELKSCGMGLLLDIVPNHMAASLENPWWADVLEKGQGSPYAAFFDIDWNAPDSREKISYRRFFDISDLVGVRVEDPGVFEAAHTLILRLVREGRVTGLRIDHIDGLYDPLGYLSRLQRRIRPEKGAHRLPGFYIVVEKILAGDEVLPAEWPVSGTTGYDFLNALNALSVDGEGVKAIDDCYSRFAGAWLNFDDLVYEKKKQVMRELFAAEVRVLGDELAQLTSKGLSKEEMTGALIEVTACLPVYRTYIRAVRLSPRDRLYLEQAAKAARRRNPALAGALDFLRQALLLDFPADFSPEEKKGWLQFVLGWQQWSGAVMAKGFEDTALYTHHRLLSLNEVGGDPAHSGLTIDDFHRFNQLRLARSPYTLNATSTHDTKRSQDVRARINVLSEIPGEWERHLARWSRCNQHQKRKVKGLSVPEPNTEVLLYQTLLGAWPFYREEVPEFKRRLKNYMVKAVREAKTFTSWLEPDPEYEAAVIGFVDSILEASPQNQFLPDFLRFQERIAHYGFLNSLSQLLLKVASPGVPDFYQGTELWELSLVDPDNRRPVDFQKRTKLLDGLIRQEAKGQPVLIKSLLKSWEDGRVKFYLTYKALNFRRSHRELFRDGDYLPLEIRGQRQGYVCAFGRGKVGSWVLVAVPRLLTKLISAGDLPLGEKVWGDDFLALPRGAAREWHNVLTGETINVSGAAKGLPLSCVLSLFPVALLTGSD